MGWVRRLRSTVLGSHASAEFEEEARFHLEQRIDEYVKSGMTPDEARREATRRLGSLTLAREQTRDVDTLRWLTDLGQDARYAVRTLRKNPGFATVAILTLALGIGANTAIFSLVNAVMVRLLPVRSPDELVMVLLQRPGAEPEDGLSNAIWEAVRDQQDVFSGVFAWSPVQFSLAQNGGTQPIDGAIVSGDYFNTLGIAPTAGRLIAETDDHRGCSPIAVLSDGFWQTHFGRTEDVLGSTIALNGQSFQVIGVSDAAFYGVEVGKKFDVAVPLCASSLFDKRNLDSRGRWWLSIMGRVKSGVTPGQLQSRLEILSPTVMRAAMPNGDAATQARFLQRRLVMASAAAGPSSLRRTFGDPLKLLMGAVALVLLIACANIAGLMLARATRRGKEIGIRTALGASRSRLVRQLLTESVLLSSLGAALGLFFARFATVLIVRSLATGRNSIFVDLSLDYRILGFTTGVAVLTGLLVGLAPAMRSTRVSLTAAMKSSQAAGSDRRSWSSAGRWMVAGQVALSLVLLVGGGLLLRTFVKLLTLDTGFDRNNVLVVTAKPAWFAGDTLTLTPEQRAGAFDDVGQRLLAIPGVISIARSYTTPIGDDNWMTTISSDVSNTPTGDQATAYFNIVTPGYFGTLRTPLVAGRDFNERDTKTSSPVAIVNESVAHTFFPGVSALGRHFRARVGQAAAIEIVGIVKDSKYESLREVTPPTVFLPAVQAPNGGAAEELLVRTSITPSSLIPTIQRAVAEMNQDIPLKFSTLAEQVADNLVQERLLATLAGFFGALALLLAMVGFYGLLSYLVTHRQAEFGIRMALGAEPGSILRLVMRDVVIVLASGLTVGLAVSLLTVSLLQRLLFGLEARDMLTMVTAVGVLSVMALLAGYVPARRATRVDPMVALRSE